MNRPTRLRSCLAVSGALIAASLLRAFIPLGSVWPNGDITLQLQLGKPPSTLADGSTSWDTVAESALKEWNAQMSRSQFVAVLGSAVPEARRNGFNNVFFSPDVFGTAWGSGVLGVTLTTRNASTGVTSESDVLFNSNRIWDSYRGPLRRSGNTGIPDLQRTALHEFGHVIGLDHPDSPSAGVTPQFINAIMNANISDLDTLQADDIAGANSLYAANSGPPVIVSQPVSRTLPVGGAYTFAVAATGTGPFTYAWGFRAAGSNTTTSFNLATGPSYTIGSVQLSDAGTYTAAVSNANSTTVSDAATLAVTPLVASPDTLLINLSTFGIVGSNDSEQLIAGLVIRGSTPKTVLIRAVGPGLADFGITHPLATPQLQLVDAAGATVVRAAAWGASPDAAKFPAAFTRLGAFQFKAGSADSAILATLPPGSYTALVSGNGGTGAALVEAYDADLDAATSRTRRFVNIATRGRVGTGADVLTAGLVVSGPGPHTYLIRAVGITLAGAPFNLPGVLIDPFLQLYQGENLLRENDDWDTPSSAQPALRAAATQVGAFALRETRDATIHSGLDSAMIVTLQPGNYTAKVTGFESATGIALVEVYELP